MLNPEHLSKEDRLDSLSGAIESGSLFRLQHMLNALHPAEIAHLLESSPAEQRKVAWELIRKENEGPVLIELNEEVRTQLTDEMEAGDLVEALKDLDTDDMADLLQGLPDSVIRQTLNGMGRQDRERVIRRLAKDLACDNWQHRGRADHVNPRAPRDHHRNTDRHADK